MSTLHDAIQAHSQPELRRHIKVAEWSLDGGKTPLSIYYTMVTLDDLHQANDLAGSGATNRIAPYLIAMKATNELGEKLFKTGDVPWLRENAAPDVMQRIAISMLGQVSIEDARGN